MKRKPLRTRARENNPITVAVLRRLQSRACPVCGSKARERCFDIEKGGHVNGPWIHSERMSVDRRPANAASTSRRAATSMARGSIPSA